MLAISDNPYAPQWQALGRSLPRPRAILAISAHWYVPETAVTAQLQPPTLHDFGGFPRPLFDVQYPAPGDPDLARRIASLLAPTIQVRQSEEWGLDHGTWSVLRHLHPAADIPVVQLSLDARKPGRWHHELGRRLSVLRDEGIQLIGSGNIVHNLGRVRWESDAPTHPWAAATDRWFAERILARDADALCDLANFDGNARLAVPTPEHYLPLLYILGAADAGDTISFPIEGIDMSALSMRCCLCQPTANR
jgi:4,5-DOPA dioxygenase extradiol